MARARVRARARARARDRVRVRVSKPLLGVLGRRPASSGALGCEHHDPVLAHLVRVRVS